MVLYEENAEYAAWSRLFFIIPTGLLIAGMSILASYQDLARVLSLLGTGVFLGLLFFFIMPRKYQIYQDRLKMVLGGSFAIDIPLSTIEQAKHVPGRKAFITSGSRIRLITSTRYVIEIVRTRGPSYAFSPQNGERFLEQLCGVLEK